MRKGVYPYDYMNCFEKFNDTELPTKELFYNKLNDTHISDDDYQHAQNIWKQFNMKTMKEYHDLYLKLDVLLLADVCENFRKVCLKNYKLDPAYYYTAPGIAWDACLKITKIKLELFSDEEKHKDMFLMIEKGIRGGVSTISTRYAKANNKYMDNYDKSKLSKYLIYLDANNLYGWGMSQNLPTHDFEYMTKKNDKIWKDIPCILEVDLEYPQELHDLHNDYPLAPEHLEINGTTKLIPNLYNKKNYIIHHETLKLYLDLGMKLTKIHRGIKFNESPWMKVYIELNTKLRSQAKNDFEKDFFKLMNNSVYGKTLENIRNHKDIRLVNNRESASRYANKPNFHHCTIFDENLIAVHMKRTKLVLNKPIYLGFSILERSKQLMYEFHYKYIKAKYGDKAKLLFTDTDSLMYEIETEDFYNDISTDVLTRFDTSNFPKDHPSGILTGMNKKIPGLFKDEAGGQIIYEFCGLRSKLYSLKMYKGKEEKKCKGIKKSVVKNEITHQDYINANFSGELQYRTMNKIRSYKHELYTETVNKIALSADDDKRIIREDKIQTYAYGHYATL